jgi:hypothetical protein
MSRDWDCRSGAGRSTSFEVGSFGFKKGGMLKVHRPQSSCAIRQRICNWRKHSVSLPFKEGIAWRQLLNSDVKFVEG